jgi:hypothetical protein
MVFQKNNAGLYSALVWILAGVALVIYCILGLLNTTIPGFEELVTFLSEVEADHIYAVAFISIFIEGLYFVGSFFPGATLVVIVAILSQLSGTTVFIGTILSIFIGWCLVGAVNIFLAKTCFLKMTRIQEHTEYEVKDRLWTTWYPAFRANYEVAQITEGGNPMKVFLSSVRVKFWASIAAAMYVLIIPFFIDIEQVSNEEGFLSVAIIAVISFAVGFLKIREHLLVNQQ